MSLHYEPVTKRPKKAWRNSIERWNWTPTPPGNIISLTAKLILVDHPAAYTKERANYNRARSPPAPIPTTHTHKERWSKNRQLFFSDWCDVVESAEKMTTYDEMMKMKTTEEGMTLFFWKEKRKTWRWSRRPMIKAPAIFRNLMQAQQKKPTKKGLLFLLTPGVSYKPRNCVKKNMNWLFDCTTNQGSLICGSKKVSFSTQCPKKENILVYKSGPKGEHWLFPRGPRAKFEIQKLVPAPSPTLIRAPSPSLSPLYCCRQRRRRLLFSLKAVCQGMECMLVCIL